MQFVFPKPTSSRTPRDVSLLTGLQDVVSRGGGVVSHDVAPDAVPLHLLTGNRVPDIAPGELVACPSPDAAAYLEARGARTMSYLPVIDRNRLDANPTRADWLDWNSSDYRVYTVVPSHEVSLVYPLVLAFVREYNGRDAVSLTIRGTGNRKPVVDAVNAAVAHAAQPAGLRAKVRVNCGPWQEWEQALLAMWGDCCLLPWSGCDAPIEALYAMAAGNFVAATAWSAGGVLTAKSGTLLSYALDTDAHGPYAKVDWTQVSAVLRVAVANGRRTRFPAMAAARQAFRENSTFCKDVMSKLGDSNDLAFRGTPCTLSSPELSIQLVAA